MSKSPLSDRTFRDYSYDGLQRIEQKAQKALEVVAQAMSKAATAEEKEKHKAEAATHRKTIANVLVAHRRNAKFEKLNKETNEIRQQIRNRAHSNSSELARAGVKVPSMYGPGGPMEKTVSTHVVARELAANHANEIRKVREAHEGRPVEMTMSTPKQQTAMPPVPKPAAPQEQGPVQTGPRGGQFYLSDNGTKVYVPR